MNSLIKTMSIRSFVFGALFLFGIGLQSMFSQNDNRIPITAKTAQRASQLYLRSISITDAKLYRLESSQQIFSLDTLLVKPRQDSIYYRVLEWNGRAYSWEMFYRTYSVGTDSVIKVVTYLDTNGRFNHDIATVYNDNIFFREDTLGLVDSLWLDSDSIANKNECIGLFREFGDYVIPRLLRIAGLDVNTKQFYAYNYWNLYEVNNQLLEFNATTGEHLRTAVVSVNEDCNRKTLLWIFPNPVQEYFRLDTQEGLLNMCLLSLDGKVVKNWNVSDQNLQFDVSDVTNGCYFVRIFQNGNYQNYPIVIKH